MSAVDEVKARLDIVDVVGGYVPLQKAGRYFKAPCPFHTERTPSFIVSPDRQTWHCFGACATGGDVISFVARKENLDFAGALRLLAERAGIDLRADGMRRQQAKTLLDANEAAALFFHSLLPHARHALAYAEERGLDRQAINDFEVGYAPAGWQTLRDYLVGRGFAPELLVEAGLLIEGERGPYDRFRERLMFPIRDERGRVVGFGGRLLPSSAGDSGPKYMNTPQTPIFDKGSVLYGLERAASSIRQQGVAVVVEGYMDVIAAHQHGFGNVVAAMGTALTERQAALLRRFAQRIVMAMDADEAGSAANLRAVQVVTAARPSGGARGGPLDVRVLTLPVGKDPDEMIRADPGAWPAAVEAAPPLLEHYFELARRGRDLADPAQREALVAEMLPVIAELPVAQQLTWVSRVARGSRAAEERIWLELRRRARAARRPAKEETPSRESEPAQSTRQPRRAPAEEFCLALLYRYPQLAAPLQDRLNEELFSLSENRELFRRWQNETPVLEEEVVLFEHYCNVLETRIPSLETSELEVAFSDCVERLQRARMRAVKEASALALASGEAGARPGRVVSVARARLEAGESGEDLQDGGLEAAAVAFLEDMKAGLLFHGRQIEDPRAAMGRGPSATDALGDP